MISIPFDRKSIEGFTLIELLVSIGIMLGMTGILLGNYPESTIKLTLSNANNALSLLIREAQMKGSAVESQESTIGGYGVYINLATSSQLIFFGDVVDDSIIRPEGLGVGDGLYSTNITDEQKRVIKLLPGYSYKKLCIGSSTASLMNAPYGFLCNGTSTPEIKTLTVSFNRPNSTAHIYINDTTETDYTSACIQLYSPKSPKIGHIQSLIIYHSGMLITTAQPCD